MLLFDVKGAENQRIEMQGKPLFLALFGVLLAAFTLWQTSNTTSDFQLGEEEHEIVVASLDRVALTGKEVKVRADLIKNILVKGELDALFPESFFQLDPLSQDASVKQILGYAPSEIATQHE